MEAALIEVPTMRRFAGIDLMSDRIPDETTILAYSFGEGFAYRHLLEEHNLGELRWILLPLQQAFLEGCDDRADRQRGRLLHPVHGKGSEGRGGVWVFKRGGQRIVFLVVVGKLGEPWRIGDVIAVHGDPRDPTLPNFILVINMDSVAGCDG